MNRLAIMLIVAGCTGSANYFIPYAPKSGPADEGDHRRAVLALTDLGKTIETNDPASGIVVTAWEPGRGFGQEKTSRYRFRVSIDAGRYDVAALCQTFTDTLGDDDWQNCEDVTKLPRWAVETTEKVATALE
ncbi:MAG: hypothetical protein R2939_22360 [Kofleriaceae bacterium]